MFGGAITYSVREFSGINVLDVSGNLTVLTADYFKSVVHNFSERESIMINMENVPFVTASGLNALVDVSYYARNFGNRVIILGANIDLKEAIDYVNYFDHIIFAQSLQEGKTKIEYYT
ncbi:MAG TPA: STAS domain-containing protein [Spirochaetota bacterium]|jgi:anti-anti-sigma factor|nr:STAS domain-containing protein [Spirochaetota bacterium]OQA96892.1 MAG: STAS domain protein [Spirochaetes bacterium ADurb.Bin218]HOK01950.1 STAS domain-containing protein [Spirochaetota bacterium]HOK91626.1 STAS domain-containing protein [Spirochaetota bacterium]HON15917.1 STAS domain-containing protein [Spirochaetota bacterium]